MTSIVNDTKAATALDFVFRTGMIYWSDVSEQRIYNTNRRGSDKTVVVKDQTVTSDGLAVDWIYNHIYFTDIKKSTIELTNFDGNMGKILIKDDLEIPRAIALDPIDGWMYWTDWGTTPRIERAGMDGTHRQVIVNYEVKWPNGLTLDLVRKRVYWVDAKLNVISSCNYDGSKRAVVLYSADYLRHPFSITTFEDYVYWTDWDKEAVFKANKFNGKDIEPVTAMHMLQHPMTIHVYHPYRQPDGTNHCQAVNGHCSHLCLPAPQINSRSPKISCACPTGLKLMDDGLMCVEDASATTTRGPPTAHVKPHGSSSNSASSSSSSGRNATTDNKQIEHHSTASSRPSLAKGVHFAAICTNLTRVEALMATLKSVRTVDKTAQHRSYLNRRWRHRTTKTQTDPDAETKTDRQTEYRYWEFRKRFNILETLYTDQFDDIGGPDGGHKEAVYGNDLHASLEYVRWLCRKYQVVDRHTSQWVSMRAYHLNQLSNLSKCAVHLPRRIHFSHRISNFSHGANATEESQLRERDSLIMTAKSLLAVATIAVLIVMPSLICGLEPPEDAAKSRGELMATKIAQAHMRNTSGDKKAHGNTRWQHSKIRVRQCSMRC
ncbi:lipophorin receptor [Culex quinquefasciatus]|uniref:Lipophorin receptor n=1 Tax=Culex quinquefasciatus TaxID=7176 RepID=B0XGD3_CULQU|nr:lipophorin receptor [Culex quinquefasciatus]|eukprot:XP_001868705.1 lipophorin receptor [Culex quinquefasciatus]